MKIAIIGVRGRVGSRIAREAVVRGHAVTGISRNIDGLVPTNGVVLRQADATDAQTLARALAAHDVVVSASRFRSSDPHALLSAVKAAGVPRLLVVGGAGSLLTDTGVLLRDTPDFAERAKPESSAGIDFLNVIRSETTLDWTFLCPSALFDPDAPRTGVFRLGGDVLLHDAAGKSWISMDDYAIAMVDEIEGHAHPRQRFCVGY